MQIKIKIEKKIKIENDVDTLDIDTIYDSIIYRSIARDTERERERVSMTFQAWGWSKKCSPRQLGPLGWKFLGLPHLTIWL